MRQTWRSPLDISIRETYKRKRIKSRKCEDAKIILKSLTAGQNTSSFSFSCSSLSWFSFLLSYFSLCSRVSLRHSSISVPVLRSSSVPCAPVLMVHPQFCISFPLPVICNFAFFGFGTFDLIGHQLIKNTLFSLPPASVRLPATLIHTKSHRQLVQSVHSENSSLAATLMEAVERCATLVRTCSQCLITSLV